MATEIIIKERFRGPPESGNGGYVCGMVANHCEGLVAVSLRKPPPLDRPLHISRDNGAVNLMDGEAVVATATPTTIDVTAPDPVSLEEAAVGADNFAAYEDHVFPGCFVCGPERTPDDGLCLFTGTVPGRDLVAAPWIPHESLADANGVVRPEFLWAALDCPGAFSFGNPVGGQPCVLGRLAVRVDREVHAGRSYVTGGWDLGEDGRKRFAGSVIYDVDGNVCAIGQATWIKIDLEKFQQ